MEERRIFRTLLGIDDALRRLLQHFTPLPSSVEVSIEEAPSRILAEDVASPIDIPSFDRATMDGYAVRAEDTFGAEEDNPRELRVIGSIAAGERPQMEVREGEAAEIATGAPLPKGSNAVVMVEHTERSGGLLRVFRAVVPGENVMAAGSDIMAGELVLRKGQKITPREMGILAAMGITRLRVYAKPKVAIVSTGSEIVSPGEALEYGKIYDINSNSLFAAVLEAGGEPLILPRVPDDPEAMKKVLKRALEEAELVLTSGSTSAGAGDLLYRVLDQLGGPGVLVHGLNLKPGKPTILAVVEGKPIIGLPGYPTSCLMVFNLLVRPLLQKMAGLEEERRSPRVQARMAYRTFAARGRRELLCVHLVRNARGEYLAFPVESGSGAITSMALADGFIDVPPTREFLEEGELVEVSLFGEALRLADLVVIGSHCIGIDLLLGEMRRAHPHLQAKVLNVGSMAGLRAIAKGEGDVAGLHLLDEESGEYNLPFIDKMGLGDKVALVRGYGREQGLLLPKGNPKRIRGLEDLLREDVRMLNRNPGSGTRLLFDTLLKRLATERGSPWDRLIANIKGYRDEAKSHTAVAVAVAQGKVDVGIGIRTVAHIHDLDFLPLALEQYDFAIPRDRLERPPLRYLMDALSSRAFHELLTKKAPGLIPSEETGSILNP